jgi:hypothetical protein
MSGPRAGRADRSRTDRRYLDFEDAFAEISFPNAKTSAARWRTPSIADLMIGHHVYSQAPLASPNVSQSHFQLAIGTHGPVCVVSSPFSAMDASPTGLRRLVV